MRGDVLPLFHDLYGRFHYGGATVHDRFGSAGAATHEQFVAVALEQPDALKRQAESFCEHLGEGRGVTLTVVHTPGDDRNGAVRLEPDAAHLFGRRSSDFKKVAYP